MQAIRYSSSYPRFVIYKALGWISPSILWSGIAHVYSEEVSEPPLPDDDWVLVKTRFGGICGTDMALIQGKISHYYEPLISVPLTIGHENIGEISKVGSDVGDWQVGDRVVVDPLLWCGPRGIDPPCSYCARGEINRCDNFTEGKLPPGILTGLCSATGGSWSPYFLAHVSQLYRVPDTVTDENGLMVEPFASSLHGVLNNFPKDDQTVMIIGAGTIGLLTLAALRSLGSEADITISARYPFQAEAAERLGADTIITDGDLYKQIASQHGARIFKPTIAKRILRGGPDLTFECAGTDSALDDALRITRTGGKVIILGVPGVARNVDWSSIFAQELEVKGAFTYHRVENFGGTIQPTFTIALNLLSQDDLDLSWLISHRFELSDYKRAFRTVGDRKHYNAIKAVFDFGNHTIIPEKGL